ncbi:MAG: RraA family protein [Streptosporangiaceae bacterium]
MDNEELQYRMANLSAANVADGCVRLGVPVRFGPPLLRPVVSGSRMAGRVLPARHVGSVDIFLEAFERAEAGDILVADNDGRLDEACIGDLVVHEAQSAGLAGVVIWGLHRDSADIQAIGLPVYSLGSVPAGPTRVDPRPEDALDTATIGNWTLTTDDLVIADEDGVLFVPADRASQVLELAESIRDTEREQAERVRLGVTLRAQFNFGEYLERRARTPALTFRDHLRGVGGAIEE